jgi:hypothetical protein
LVLEVNSINAIEQDTTISLPFAPTLRGEEILVPLRIIAEHLSTRANMK